MSRHHIRQKTLQLTFAALCLALGLVLPLLTAQVKEIGDSLLPMHFAVLLCGLLCGPLYGLSVGLVLPFLRSLLFSMPPIYPNAVWMAAELAAYGLVVGLLYTRVFPKRLGYTYCSLGIAMLLGRAVWGLAKVLLLGLQDKPFTWEMFLAGAFLDAIPGILLQLLLLPPLMLLVERLKQKKGL